MEQVRLEPAEGTGAPAGEGSGTGTAEREGRVQQRFMRVTVWCTECLPALFMTGSLQKLLSHHCLLSKETEPAKLVSFLLPNLWDITDKCCFKTGNSTISHKRTLISWQCWRVPWFSRCRSSVFSFSVWLNSLLLHVISSAVTIYLIWGNVTDFLLPCVFVFLASQIALHSLGHPWKMQLSMQYCIKFQRVHGLLSHISQPPAKTYPGVKNPAIFRSTVILSEIRPQVLF